MKEFKHPKLGRVARQKVIRYDDYINRWEIWKIISGEITYLDDYYYTKEELLALWFEEVVEETEQQKPKKFTIKLVHSWYLELIQGREISDIDNVCCWAIENFLRDHDLLEE